MIFPLIQADHPFLCKKKIFFTKMLQIGFENRYLRSDLGYLHCKWNLSIVLTMGYRHANLLSPDSYCIFSAGLVRFPSADQLIQEETLVFVMLFFFKMLAFIIFFFSKICPNKNVLERIKLKFFTCFFVACRRTYVLDNTRILC